jgi:hypothetical protein
MAPAPQDAAPQTTPFRLGYVEIAVVPITLTLLGWVE